VNREETAALWRQGKDAWDKWRLGVEKQKLKFKETGIWAQDWYGEGQNDGTKTWLEEAAADFSETKFEEDADFAGLAFPGPANFDGAQFAGAANFTGATFAESASFERAQFRNGDFTEAGFLGFASFSKARFEGVALFDRARFQKASDFAPCVRFRQAMFTGRAAFAGAQFAGSAEFQKAAFAAVSFDGAVFRGETFFASSKFAGEASFGRTCFAGSRADFGNTVFRASPRFEHTQFGRSQAELAILGACDVGFEAAHFEAGACFARAQFVGGCDFKNAQFGGPAVFDGVQFVLPAGFAPAVFSDTCSFQDAQFVRLADFTASAFLKGCAFNRTRFGSDARFDQARFGGLAHFENAEFWGEASFRDVTAEAALAFARARCVAAPDLEGGHFAVKPALRKIVKIKPRRPRPLFGRWKKSDPAAVEQEPEPPRKVWQPENTGSYEPQAFPGHSGAARGSSAWLVLRLLVVWAFFVAIFVPFYLSQRPRQESAADAGTALAGTAGLPAALAARVYRDVAEGAPCIHGKSLAVGEALVLSAKNALVLVPWESEQVSRRVYGCLYGLEEAGPAIPFAVTLAGLLQALLSLLLLGTAFSAIVRRR
jgi:Pentapeptide repeats (9 copies)